MASRSSGHAEEEIGRWLVAVSRPWGTGEVGARVGCVLAECDWPKFLWVFSNIAAQAQVLNTFLGPSIVAFFLFLYFLKTFFTEIYF